jgi:hypothetical protein
MKLFKKLNEKGFSHHLLLPVVAAVVVGGIGTYLITTSHAATFKFAPKASSDITHLVTGGWHTETLTVTAANNPSNYNWRIYMFCNNGTAHGNWRVTGTGTLSCPGSGFITGTGFDYSPTDLHSVHCWSPGEKNPSTCGGGAVTN